MNKLSFGFGTVNAGQRNNSTDPELIACSTIGGFRITPQVSKILGIAAGDFVMFINNINEIDRAVASKDEVIVNFCNERGLEVGSPEALIAIHKEFDVWAIAKGFKRYDANGNPMKVTERLTKEARLAAVRADFDKILANAMASDNNELKEALENATTVEEQENLLCPCIVGDEVDKYEGSKAANSAKFTGTNVSLTFTDNNVWNQLKSGMSDEDAKTKNRVFAIDVEDIKTLELFNGYENVAVKALLLSEYKDVDAARRKSENEDEE